MTKILRITAKRDGFRRCGIAHPGTPTDHADGRFSNKEIKALKAETMLVVEEIEVKDKGKEPEAEKPAAKGKMGGK